MEAPFPHPGLATAYPKLVSDPADADLFFVPDHYAARASSRGTTAPERLCAVQGRHWLDHMDRFKTPDGVSYLERRGGRDHFFARNRAWHSSRARVPRLLDSSRARRRRNGVDTSSFLARSVSYTHLTLPTILLV